MPGPNSYAAGDKARWEELNEIVCDVHFTCDMSPKKEHAYMTYRMWLAKRGKLHTGKTV